MEAMLRVVVGGLAIACALVLLVAGVALFLDADAWKPAAVVGSTISLALLLLFFHPWLTIGVLIDAAILASVWRPLWGE